MIFIAIMLVAILGMLSYLAYLVQDREPYQIRIITPEPEPLKNQDLTGCSVCARGKPQKDDPESPTVMSPDYIRTKFSFPDAHGFEAAVREERRQMAFDKFCLEYNEELDIFCSRDAGHDVLFGPVRGEVDRSKLRHGHAGVFWQGL